MNRRYRYIGPRALMHLASSDVDRVHLTAASVAIDWAREHHQEPGADGSAFLTFIVDTDNRLWIADRSCEHIACARGEDVLSAGEVMFDVSDRVEATYVSNQSTGYCPEPESWPVVARALNEAGIEHPNALSRAFHFRRCPKCDDISIIKDDWFQCELCQAELPRSWNVDSLPG